MKREELMQSPAYWTTEIQLELFREIEKFMQDKGMNRAQFAEYLGCTRGYVTQLLNGDFDNKLSKLVDLSLKIGKVPVVHFVDVNNMVNPHTICLKTEGGRYGEFNTQNIKYIEIAA